LRTRYFYLRDSNQVDLMAVWKMASFALSLQPHDGIKEADCYAVALHEYMKNNIENILFESYNLLISDPKGVELLRSNITICLLEKSFREEGANTESIQSYVAAFDKYHKLLTFNDLTYGNRTGKPRI